MGKEEYVVSDTVWWSFSYGDVCHHLYSQGRSEEEVDAFIAKVEKVLTPFLEDFGYRLFWAGNPIADKTTSLIIKGLLQVYPEYADRIIEDSRMEPDVLLVVDIAAAKEEVL